jgi:hypothetical protein
MIKHIHTASGSGEGQRQDLTDGGSRAAGHHDDTVGEKQSFVDIMGPSARFCDPHPRAASAPPAAPCG